TFSKGVNFNNSERKTSSAKFAERLSLKHVIQADLFGITNGPTQAFLPSKGNTLIQGTLSSNDCRLAESKIGSISDEATTILNSGGFSKVICSLSETLTPTSFKELMIESDKGFLVFE